MTETTLLRALLTAGAGSRRSLADTIINGGVEVNGRPVDNLKHPVNTAKDKVTIDGKPVDLRPQETVCLMLHKPKDVLSTTADERGRRTVMDILPERYGNIGLYPAGRLDKDTTGLLLLTNDGNLTYRLTHPKFEHEKEYLVHIDGKLTAEEKRQFEKGIKLEDGWTSPAKISESTPEPPYNYSLTVHEGKKRQVRRMFEKLKHPVIDLKRVRIGGLRLGDLKEGKARPLNSDEIMSILK
jgi:23S rRNA pseudouridine2605 synthase